MTKGTHWRQGRHRLGANESGVFTKLTDPVIPIGANTRLKSWLGTFGILSKSR
jgi:hypothetical protein